LFIIVKEFCRVLVTSAFLLHVSHHAIAAEPIVPCGSAPSYPAYAPPGPLPTLALWRAGELPKGWIPSECTGWASREGGTLFAVAGRFKHESSFDALLTRAGAFSHQTEIQHWNLKEERWEQQYKASAALKDSDPSSRRPDFKPSEFTQGAHLYFVQDAMDSLGPIVHELTVRERSPSRLVMTTRNANRGKVFGVPVIAPDGLEGFFVVEHESGPLWRYYSMTRVNLLISDAMAPPPEDYLNKAVALFRFLTSMPTDTEPPAAR